MFANIPDISYSQLGYDVISFDENNTWWYSIDPDIDTAIVYPGDCLYIPIYLFFDQIHTMNAWVLDLYVDSTYNLNDISLENTIFSDRYEDLEICSFDTVSNRYTTYVSSRPFDPCYESDDSVYVAYWLELNIHTNLDSLQSYLYPFNVILIDSTGYLSNVDDALLRIIIRNLPFERGDVDHDSLITQNDLIVLLDYVFRDIELPYPRGVGDINYDGAIDIIDVLILKEQIY